MTSVYGNAPAGEHNAVLRTTSPEKFPNGTRFVVGFLVVNDEGTEPIYDHAGEPLVAVAVCNMISKGTAKSKQFKIRKALLLADEFDPIASATSVPDWPYFMAKQEDGRYRTTRIRVEQQRTSDGRTVSIVTHIQRPRDGVWQCIAGEFDGPPFPWVRLDGTRKPLSDSERKLMSPLENRVYEFWTSTLPVDPRWITVEGVFKPLSSDAIDALSPNDRAMYEVARGKAALTRRNQP